MPDNQSDTLRIGPLCNQRRRVFGWLSPELAITLILLLVAFVVAFQQVRSDVRNTTTLVEQHTRDIEVLARHHEEDHALLLELKGDLKLVLERTDPARLAKP